MAIERPCLPGCDPSKYTKPIPDRLKMQITTVHAICIRGAHPAMHHTCFKFPYSQLFIDMLKPTVHFQALIYADKEPQTFFCAT